MVINQANINSRVVSSAKPGELQINPIFMILPPTK